MECMRGFFSFKLLTCVLMCEWCLGDKYVTRKTKYGHVRGLVEKVHGHRRVEKFLGVPYARPPVGELRLEAPVTPLKWGKKPLDTLELPPACLQPQEGIDFNEHNVPGFNKSSEDCLYLNIYVPKGGSHRRPLPVLVFIHGGSYRNGMGATMDGSMLSTYGIVVVTVNYRLGALGFLTSADDTISGNYGMLDMVQALLWVQENIAHFHGDPNSVTIDGHSAGGCSVGLLMVSPLSKGLFHRVIQQSGSPLAQWSVSRVQHRPGLIYRMFISAVGCYSNSSAKVKACIQSMNSSELERIIKEDFEWSVSLTPKYRPVVDGYFLPDTPEALVESGELNSHSILMGTTKDEGIKAAIPLIKLFGRGKTGARKLLSLMTCFRADLPEVPGITDSTINRYIQWGQDDISEAQIQNGFSEIVGDYFITAPTHLMASQLAKRNVSVFLYSYEYKSIFNQDQGVGHGAELLYLAGCPFTGHDNYRYSEDDRKMAKILILLWTNFVKSGTPSTVPELAMSLPQFHNDRKLYSRLFSKPDPEISVASNLRPDKIAFWNRDVPNMSIHRNNWTVPKLYSDIYNTHTNNDVNTDYTENIRDNYMLHTTDKKTWILTSVCLCLSVLTVVLTIAYYKMRREVTRLLRQSGLASGERMLPQAKV